ncbi:MAG: circadian clock KaiB family protein [Gemmataceae bacterium]
MESTGCVDNVDQVFPGRLHHTDDRYLLRLFVTGLTERSTQAVATVRAICEQRLPGRYDLEIIDLYQEPDRAKGEQIIAAPTLLKKTPLPLRRLIGDLANEERVLRGLDLVERHGA